MNKFLPISCLIILLLSRCSKTATVETGSITDYYPLVVGKYFVYKIDSSLYVSFGQVKEIHSNTFKDIVDAAITDNLGRQSYRMRRLLRNKTDTSIWTEHTTYLVTPQPNSLEVIEDNLRFIKLQLPIQDYFSWNGNRYLPDEAYPQFGFNSTAHSRLDSWEYNYENTNGSDTVNGKPFLNTITVTCSIADSAGFPPRDVNGPAFKTIWEEKYAKGIGLISRIVSLEEFQPRSSTYPNGYYSGFGLKQTLVDHN